MSDRNHCNEKDVVMYCWLEKQKKQEGRGHRTYLILAGHTKSYGIAENTFTRLEY